MNFIVSGERGFIGKALVRYIESKGNKVSFFKGDLCDEKTYETVQYNEPYILIHLAGDKSRNKNNNLTNNVMLLTQMIRCVDWEMCVRFIYFSSIAVYGMPEGKINLQSELNPFSIYGKSKLICEKLVENYTPGVPYTIVRPTNIYSGVEVGVLQELYKTSINQEKFILYKESMDSKRDYISLKDVVQATYDLAVQYWDMPDIDSEIINLGSGFSYSVSELIYHFDKVFEKKIQVDIQSNHDINCGSYILDVSDIKKRLQWEFADLKNEIDAII